MPGSVLLPLDLHEQPLILLPDNGDFFRLFLILNNTDGRHRHLGLRHHLSIRRHIAIPNAHELNAKALVRIAIVQAPLNLVAHMRSSSTPFPEIFADV